MNIFNGAPPAALTSHAISSLYRRRWCRRAWLGGASKQGTRRGMCTVSLDKPIGKEEGKGKEEGRSNR